MKLIFLFLLISLNSFSLPPTLVKNFGLYKVILTWEKWDQEEHFQKLIVYHKDKIVFSEGELGSYYWLGNNFDEEPNDQDPYYGQDITGNRVPDLVITSWNGGAHCCHFLTIFEMTNQGLKKLISIDGGSYYFKIKDLDGDKIPEIEFMDWPIDYLFNSFADSAQGRVVLKFKQGKYQVAKNLMLKKRPNDKNLNYLKTEIKKSFKGMGDRIPYQLLKIMMDLSYSGYKELALKIADETWPHDRSDLIKFKNEFSQALRDSIYWREFDRRSI
jgi:hypothetical protein